MDEYDDWMDDDDDDFQALHRGVSTPVDLFVHPTTVSHLVAPRGCDVPPTSDHHHDNNKSIDPLLIIIIIVQHNHESNGVIGDRCDCPNDDDDIFQ